MDFNESKKFVEDVYKNWNKNSAERFETNAYYVDGFTITELKFKGDAVFKYNGNVVTIDGFNIEKLFFYKRQAERFIAERCVYFLAGHDFLNLEESKELKNKIKERH